MVTPLEWLLTAKDDTKAAFESLSSSLEKSKGKMDALKIGATLMAGGILTATGFIAKGAVDAYTKGEQAQAALNAAYQHFPKLANENIDKLRELNDAIEAKTGFDHNDLATAEAKLAMFDLTGKQIAELTPLVADYAARTGKDMSSAARAVGLALEGQNRGLKQIGINLPAAAKGATSLAAAQAAATVATNDLYNKQAALADIQQRMAAGGKHAPSQSQERSAVDAVTMAQEKLAKANLALSDAQGKSSVTSRTFGAVLDGLKSKVGGYATTLGDTAAGKTRILNAEWQAMLEKVGALLVPTLTALADIGVKVLTWLNKNPVIVQILTLLLGALAVVLGVVTAAMWAMSLTPIVLIIGAIVLAVALLIAGIILLIMHWKEVVAWVTNVWAGFVSWVQQTLVQFLAFWNKTWTDIGQFFQNLWNGFVTWVQNLFYQFMLWLFERLVDIGNKWIEFWTGVGQFVQNAWMDWIVNPIKDAVNWIVSAIQNGLALVQSGWNIVWSGLGDVVKNIFNGVISFIQNGMNGVIGVVNGVIGGINSVGGAIGVHLGTVPTVSLPHFADGGTSAGGLAWVGERGPELVNLRAGDHVNSNGSKLDLSDNTIKAIARELALAIVPGIQHHSSNVATGLIRAAFD